MSDTPNFEPFARLQITERRRRLLWEAITMVDIDTLNDNLARVHQEDTGPHELNELAAILDHEDKRYDAEWTEVYGAIPASPE